MKRLALLLLGTVLIALALAAAWLGRGLIGLPAVAARQEVAWEGSVKLTREREDAAERVGSPIVDRPAERQEAQARHLEALQPERDPHHGEAEHGAGQRVFEGDEQAAAEEQPEDVQEEGHGEDIAGNSIRMEIGRREGGPPLAHRRVKGSRGGYSRACICACRRSSLPAAWARAVNMPSSPTRTLAAAPAPAPSRPAPLPRAARSLHAPAR